MKALIATAAVVAMLATQTPAYASPGCNGCNLVDEGSLNQSLVGKTVYLGSTPYSVRGVNTGTSVVYLRSASGENGWGNAREFYSRQARTERDQNITVGVVGGLAVLAAIFSGGGSSSSKSSSSSYSAGGSKRTTSTYDERPQPTYTPSYSPPKPDTSVGCAWGDRAYGTC